MIITVLNAKLDISHDRIIDISDEPMPDEMVEASALYGLAKEAALTGETQECGVLKVDPPDENGNCQVYYQNEPVYDEEGDATVAYEEDGFLDLDNDTLNRMYVQVCARRREGEIGDLLNKYKNIAICMTASASVEQMMGVPPKPGWKQGHQDLADRKILWVNIPCKSCGGQMCADVKMRRHRCSKCGWGF